jgi:ubiquinol-cytochrome c reductase iron-sulfur subunit
MSDNEEPQEPQGPVPPHRVIGTPQPGPRLLGPADGADGADATNGTNGTDGSGHGEGAGVVTLTSEPENPEHAKQAERVVAALFVLAFLGGCGFIAAYVGLEVHSVNAVLRSNLALGISLSVTLLAFASGTLIWVRHLMPDVEMEEERHEMQSTPQERAAFQEYAVQGSQASQVGKRPLVRRTLLLATAPLALAPVVLLRDLGPLPGTSLRHTVWSPGRRLLVYGTNQPVTPAEFSAPGSMITVVPDGYQDDLDALAKAAVILIKFAPSQLNVPTSYDGSTLIGTMNWTVDNIVAYSKICTHVGCPVALYEQTTHHILCPCHQSTFQAAEGARVIFGPAARPLPQLPMTVDSDGYLVAKSDFTQPVGPSFWERG